MNKDNLILSLLLTFLKIFSVLYIIPLYLNIGIEGSFLYGITLVFINIFSSIGKGISKSIDSILDKYDDKKIIDVYKRSIFVLNIILFLVFITLSSFFGNLLAESVNSFSENIIFVIRVSSFYILLTTYVDIYREYLLKKNLDKSLDNSKMLEDFFNALLIIFSLIIYHLFKIDIKYFILLLLLSNLFGKVIAVLYMKFVISRYKEKKIIKKKLIYKNIVYLVGGCSFPFIVLELFNSFSMAFDLFLTPRILLNTYKYSIEEIYEIFGDLYVWCPYLNLLIFGFISGIITHLMNNKKFKNLLRRFRKGVQLSIFVALPIIVLISIISSNIWNFFFGDTTYGVTMFPFYIYLVLFDILFIICSKNMLSLKKNKIMYISLVIGLLSNILLKIPLMYGFNLMGLPVYYGMILSIMIGYLIPIIVSIIYINHISNVDYEEGVKNLIDIITSIMIMAIVLVVIKIVIPFRTKIRILNLLFILIYSFIGAIIYLLLSIKNKSFDKNIGDIEKIVGGK